MWCFSAVERSVGGVCDDLDLSRLDRLTQYDRSTVRENRINSESDSDRALVSSGHASFSLYERAF
jgi:hypothetical protein